MPRDSNGNFSLVPSYLAVTGQNITVPQHNPPLEDIAAAITGSLPRNGTAPMLANLPMGGFKVTGLADGTAQTDAATVAQVQSSTPIGVVLDYVGGLAPPGWLLCYGQELSRVDYSALFAVISTTFGGGNGSTTFNIPDYRGRVGAGQDDMGGVSADRLTGQPGGVNGDAHGAVGGSETHVLTTAQIAEHAHSGTTNSAGSHSHTGYFGGNHTGSYSTTGGQVSGAASSTDAAGAHQHTLTTNPAGGGGAHNNVQPTIIVNKIIKF